MQSELIKPWVKLQSTKPHTLVLVERFELSLLFVVDKKVVNWSDKVTLGEFEVNFEVSFVEKDLTVVDVIEFLLKHSGEHEFGHMANVNFEVHSIDVSL